MFAGPFSPHLFPSVLFPSLPDSWWKSWFSGKLRHCSVQRPSTHRRIDSTEALPRLTSPRRYNNHRRSSSCARSSLLLPPLFTLYKTYTYVRWWNARSSCRQIWLTKSDWSKRLKAFRESERGIDANNIINHRSRLLFYFLETRESA